MSPLATGMLVAATLGLGLPLVLRRVAALDHWPRLAAWLWLILPVGALGALTFVAGLLALADHALAAQVSEVLHTCASVLTAGLAGPAQASSLPAGGLVGVLAVGAVYGVAVGTVRARRALRHHRDLLALTAVQDARVPGVRVLEHPTPVAYSLPGGPATVVVSTGVLERLTTEQLDAVIAHEQAHRRGRHHLLILLAEILRLGFPWLPAARIGRAGVERSGELAADDAAARRCGRQHVIQALLQLHHVPSTPPQLGMAASGIGPTVTERVRRLLRPVPRPYLPVVTSSGAVGDHAGAPTGQCRRPDQPRDRCGASACAPVRRPHVPAVGARADRHPISSPWSSAAACTCALGRSCWLVACRRPTADQPGSTPTPLLLFSDRM